MLINISDDLIRLQSMGLLGALLQDRSTRKNIMWATDAYLEQGTAYGRSEEIFPELITGEHIGLIKTRARKAFEQQSERTKKHAEVFTPLWIVKKMNDYADEVWFGRREGFDRFLQDFLRTAEPAQTLQALSVAARERPEEVLLFCPAEAEFPAEMEGLRLRQILPQAGSAYTETLCREQPVLEVWR